MVNCSQPAINHTELQVQ